ncbi:hypothetical protein Bca4012_058597 [Brassica carinata]
MARKIRFLKDQLSKVKIGELQSENLWSLGLFATVLLYSTAERAETLLHCLELFCPQLSQTSLDDVLKPIWRAIQESVKVNLLTQLLGMILLSL